jgi:hypothetical protein
LREEKYFNNWIVKDKEFVQSTFVPRVCPDSSNLDLESQSGFAEACSWPKAREWLAMAFRE